FFFSSRRRHTISTRDWSSDVCSSDLTLLELIGTRSVFAHFGVMSNELSTPKILFCPQETDPSRQSASTFASTIPAGSVNQVPFTNDNNISYFVGVDAVDTSPQMVLTGDRNLSVHGVLV